LLFHSLILLGLISSFFLAGGPRQGASGVFLLCAGLAMIVSRPICVVDRRFWIMALIMVVAVCLALLPAFLAGVPEWRLFLRALPEFHDPLSISVSPRETLYWAALLTLSIVLGFALLAHPLNGLRLEKIALAAVVGVALYAGLAAFSWMSGWHYPFFDQDSGAQAAFGFFPNRNHTAGLLLASTIVGGALVFEACVAKRFFFAFAAVMPTMMTAAGVLFLSKSRGGIIFLLLGVLIWVCGLGRRWLRLLLPALAPLVLVAGVLFFIAPEGARDRLMANSSAASEGRPGIARDALRMVAAHPVTGSGLGTFASLYPFYADSSLWEATALHAESDWLTFLEEAGLLALAAAVGFLILLASDMWSSRDAPSWPLRWGVFSAFLAEVCHGMVDVPAHRPELGWWMLFLATVACKAGGPANPSAIKWQRRLFIAAGVASLLVGLMLMKAQWIGGYSLPPYAVVSGANKVDVLNQQGKHNEAARLGESLRRNYPFGWFLGYREALCLPPEEADSKEKIKGLVNVENALRPLDSAFPLVAASMFIPKDPDLVGRYWKEALSRRLVMEQKVPNLYVRSNEMFRQLMETSSTNTVLLPLMPDLARMAPSFRKIWLKSPVCPVEEISAAVQDDGYFASLPLKERTSLVSLWWNRGNHQEVENYVLSHPSIGAAGIPVRASVLEAKGKDEEACRLIIEGLGVNVDELTVNTDGRIHAATTPVPLHTVDAVKYYLERGNDGGALYLLEEAMKKDSTPNPELLRLSAILEMRRSHWKEALSDLRAFLLATGQD
jgi:O-antigen ligase